MAAVPLEERISHLEEDVAELKKRLGPRPAASEKWWERIVGTFADDPAFEEATRLGREYRTNKRRRSLRRLKG